jgi:hypothetical protein
MSWKPCNGEKIERVYAWIATDQDGSEGIISIEVGDIHYPLIGADTERIESLRTYARRVQMMTGYPIKLVEFDGCHVIEEL